MNKNELYKKLADEEKRVEKAKQKRCIITILFFAVVFFIIMYTTEHPAGIEILGAFLASVVLAGIYFYVNSLIFVTLHEKGKSETRWLESIRKEISELEKQDKGM